MKRAAARAVAVLWLIVSAMILMASPASAAAAPGFANVTNIGGQVVGLAASADYIYVGRRYVPTVLVYDVVSGTLLAEVSLLSVSGESRPIGVTAIALGSDSSAIIGTEPYGEIFRCTGLAATSLGRPSGFDLSDRCSTITAIASVGDRLFFGARGSVETGQARMFRTTSGVSLAGMSEISMTGNYLIYSLGGHGTTLGIGTEDTTTPKRGRFYLYDVVSGVLNHVYHADSAVTAVSSAGDTILFFSTPSRMLRTAGLSNAGTLTETIVHAMAFGVDGSETAVFIGAETHVLRRWSAVRGLTRFVDFNTAMTSIKGLQYIPQRDRLYGVGQNAAGSFLFYYDTTAPRLDSVHYSMETALRQPSTPETTYPPLTRGNYTVRLTTNEKLFVAPTLTAFFSDGTSLAVTMTGSLRNYAGTIAIDSTRPGGTVTFAFVGVDDAGNTGTIILHGASFEYRSIGRAVIANNMIRPGLGEFATVRYLLLSPQIVSIKVYNLRGQLVADLSPGYRAAGDYADVTWRGRNGRNELVASGIYLVRINAGSEFSTTQKIMVIR